MIRNRQNRWMIFQKILFPMRKTGPIRSRPERRWAMGLLLIAALTGSPAPKASGQGAKTGGRPLDSAESAVGQMAACNYPGAAKQARLALEATQDDPEN
jgi:hypothetical protein